jgi:SEC-C motif domain protein
MICPCCSGKEFRVCCEPFITKVAFPLTAEQLMRSRYTAYATHAIVYILETTHTSTRKYDNALSIKEWAESSIWQRLEIISIEKGSVTDIIGYVEFKAYFLDSKKKAVVHNEYSTFKKEQNVWYFVEGEIV